MAKEKMMLSADQEQGAISSSGRKSMIALAFVFAGWGLNSSEIISGGTIVGPLGLKIGLIAILIATLVNCLLGILVTIPGVKTGLGFAMLTRHSFGSIGSKLPSAVISIVHFGWYGILTALLANVTMQILPNWSFAAVAIVAGLSIAIVATVGIKATTIIGYLAVPCVLIVGLIGIVKLLGGGNAIDPALKIGTSTLSHGVSQGIGAYAVGSLLACDVSRFAKTKKQGCIGVLLGLLVGLSFVRVLGALSILSTGEADIVLAFGKMGMGAAAFIFLFLNIVSTTDNILYSTGMSLSSMLKGNRKVLTMIAGVLGTIIAVAGLDKYFGSWLNFLAAIIPPLGGVVIADFYLVKQQKLCDVEKVSCKINIFAIASWSVGIIVAMLGVWCSAIDGLIASIICYAACMFIIKATKPGYFNKITNADAEDVNFAA